MAAVSTANHTVDRCGCRDVDREDLCVGRGSPHEGCLERS